MSGPDSEDQDALIGATVAGKYRIDRLLGRGGMGAVYQATNLGINKRVALKFLDREAARDEGAVRRFQREAEAASAVESAHIVEIFDSGAAEDGRPFLVMELLRGQDLRARLREEGRLDLDVALDITMQVLRALSRAHRAGIVHRDLKPDNIFLCERDDVALFVKIVDFGISKLASSASVDTLTRRGTVLGTAFYMSPEQAQAFHDIDGRADLFSLGAIVYESLSGRPPHTGRAYEAVLVSICTRDADDIRMHAPDVPEALAEVIAKALARDREARFQSAEEFMDAIAQAVPETARLTSSAAHRRMVSSDLGLRSSPPSAQRSDAGREVDRFAAETGQGTAVQTRSTDAVTMRRRIVGAIVLGLAVFTVVSLLVATRREVPQDGAAAAGASPATSMSGSLIAAQAVSVPAVSSSAAPAASQVLPAPSTTPTPKTEVHQTTRIRRPAPTGPSKQRPPAPTSEKGVMGGLELNEQGP